MTILESDIKILASARMTDAPDGAGRMTGLVVQSGVDNNIFNDVSDLQRIYGSAEIRKVFAAVLTENVDPYLGVRFFIDEGPTDPAVSVTMLSTGSSFDTRSQIANRIESYLNGSGRYNAFLYEGHVQGQRSIQLFQRPGTTAPLPGETLLLIDDEGLQSEVRQYVRVTRTETEIRTFSDEQGDFQAQLANCDISDVLQADLPGSAATRKFTTEIGKTVTKTTVVADAGSYRGISPLATAANIGDTKIKVASIYSQLVPASRTEVSTLDQLPAATSVVTLATAPRLVQVPVAGHTYRIKIGQTNRGSNYVYLMRPAPAAGTVVVSYRALGRWYTITDNGDGTLGGSGSGVVNYLTGSISVTLLALPDAGSGVIFNWAETANFTNRSGQAGFRAPEYVFTLEHPGVQPGSVTVTWTSNNVVKTATDAAGKFANSDLVGEVDYVTGTLFLRPLAMLDAGGEFSIAYQTATQVVENLTPTVDGAGFMGFTLAQVPAPGTVGVTWVTARRVSETGGSALVETNTTKSANTSSNPITQTVNYVNLAYSPSPSSPASLTRLFTGAITTAVGTATSQKDASSSSTHKRTTTSQSTTVVEVVHEVSDNGSGGFVGSRGTITYATRALSIKAVDLNTSANGYQNDFEKAATFNSLNGLNEGVVSGPVSSNGGGGTSSTNGGGSANASVGEEVVAATTVQVKYNVAPVTPINRTMTYAPPLVTIDLCPYTSDPIVPGSVQFVWMGQTYTDYEGGIYRGRTDTTPGVLAGTLNYAAGIAQMTDYTVNGSPTNFTLSSLFTRKTGFRTAQVFCRTIAAPVKPTGFILSVTDITGAQLVASAGLDGAITGSHMTGRIDYESGVVDMLFGDYVLDSSLTAAQKLEWWYSAGDVQPNGKIFKPWPVLPETLRYNVVSFFYLPLDSTILGLDPVRLPQDGRVPIFGTGYVILVHNTQTIAAQTVTAAQTVDVGRVRLASLRVLDANDAQVYSFSANAPTASGATCDLALGTVTFTTVAGLAQPVRIVHRVEDEFLCRDAQITGELELPRPVTHSFPAGSTFVSSAILVDTAQSILQAATSESFSQLSWTNVWADARIGSPIPAQYNQTVYPIAVTNKGSLAERWALIFTNNTSFRVIGEEVGEIAQGSINAVCEPVNPATGVPYFSIDAAGWGLGWVQGNVLRFNTQGANWPIDLVRTVMQSAPGAQGTDSLTVGVRGSLNV
jgi:hypothetical protein